jgi:porin
LQQIWWQCVRWTSALAALALITGTGAVRAADEKQPAAEEEEPFDQPSVVPYLGAPFAARAELGEAGIRWRAIYTTDLLSNVSGGISRGTTFEGRLEVGVQADLEKLVGWQGALFNVSSFFIHGRGLSRDHIGNLLTVSNIEALPAARLFELWLEQKIGSFGSIRVGQLAADSEFITSENAGLFINGTFGWPGITASDLPSGGPAYPLATPGVRLELNLAAEIKLRAAVFNGDPAGPGTGDPQLRNPNGLKFPIGDGAFLIAELEHGYRIGAAALPGTIKLGAWYHTDRFDDQRFATDGRSLANPASTGIPASLRPNWGPYAVIDQMLMRLPGSGERSIGAFARVSGSPDDRNLVNFYFDTGVTVKGPFASRPDDRFGVAFGFARISDRARALDGDVQRFGLIGYPIRDYEAVLEVTYKAQIVPGWTVQPDFQYIFHPGGRVPNPNDPTQTQPIKNAVVVGVRSTVQF